MPKGQLINITAIAIASSRPPNQSAAALVKYTPLKEEAGAAQETPRYPSREASAPAKTRPLMPIRTRPALNTQQSVTQGPAGTASTKPGMR